MCSSNAGALLPYGLKIPTPGPYFSFAPNMGQLAALDFQRPQFCDYGARLHYGIRGYPSGLGMSPYHPHLADPYTQSYLYKHDLRARYIQEEPKPSQSYIGLIAMAILSAKDKKLVLSDIYQWILDNYAYFRTRGPGWRNSIRHNLSLNDCFIKSGRSANGKGHYWAVHPANVDDFGRGDFRRRRAQRKVRKHMGLAVPDEEDSPSPSPTPQATWGESSRLCDDKDDGTKDLENGPRVSGTGDPQPQQGPAVIANQPAKRRLFDMESILAPDTKRVCDRPVFSQLSFDSHMRLISSQTSPREEDDSTDADVVSKHLPKPDDEPNSTETHGSSSVSESPSPVSSPTRSLDLQDSGPSARDSSAKGTELYSWPLPGAGRVRPSAFHTTSTPTAAAWNTYATYLYPMLASSSAAYPMMLPQMPTLSAEAANRIRQTMNGLRSESPVKTDSDEQ
ncbi:forkhead box protein I3-like [Gigantopelta aegis]|uniref:forkhead box protein I3-like n=1 Tax=Gigantopelta aegis TaxID=1735272 RepID=UPI001B88B30D|nr:forkhead box protein I3-like [Gigantopelta aegis]